MEQKTSAQPTEEFSTLDPAQDDPPTVAPQQDTQEGGEASQTVLPLSVPLPVSTQDPQSPRTERESYEDRAERRDKRRLRVEIATFLVGIIGLIGLGWTLYETRRQANVAEQTLRVTQHPYIGLGRSDGVVAEYVPPPKGEEKGTILLFIQNTGGAPALSFLTNVSSDVINAPSRYEHVWRWRSVDKEGKITAWPMFQRATIGANSVHVVVIDKQWVPSADQWEAIHTDRWDGGFSLTGNIQYCDQWGTLYCQWLSVHYVPTPVERFVGFTYNCPIGFPPPLQEEYLPNRHENFPIEILPPCEQPGERKKEEERIRNQRANDKK